LNVCKFGVWSPRSAGLLCVVAISALLTVASLDASGASLTVNVRDQAGNPLENAVVSLYPRDKPPDVDGGSVRLTAVMDQRNKQFVPFVLPVRMGTAVSFPNNDNIRHHVYSFSAAKTFEIRLYTGTPSEPIIFDKPGVVVLGCNIHDQILGYIYVTESDYFAKTNPDGSAKIDQFPAGTYELRVWHPRSTAPEHAYPTIKLGPRESTLTRIELSVSPPRKSQELNPLSPLEQKFRRFRLDVP
jgi:plastocyanin